MEEWFQRACARDVDQRYPSAQAFVDALHAATGTGVPGPRLGGPTTGTPVSTTGEASSVTADGARPRTPWTAVVLSGALGLAIAVGGVALAVRALKPAHPASGPETVQNATGGPPAAGSVPAAVVEPIATIAPPPAETTVPGSGAPSAAASALASAAHRPPSAPSSAASAPWKAPSTPPAGGQPTSAPHGTRPSKPSTTVDLGY
jgi:serine/threonine-protein kinase